MEGADGLLAVQGEMLVTNVVCAMARRGGGLIPSGNKILLVLLSIDNFVQLLIELRQLRGLGLYSSREQLCMTTDQAPRHVPSGTSASAAVSAAGQSPSCGGNVENS